MEWAIRQRAWVIMGVMVVVAVLAGALGRGSRPGTVHTGAGIPRVTFGSQVQQLGATSQLSYTNGWVASSGPQTVGVYAGRQRLHPRNGLFVILRQSGGGHQRIANVVVRGSGTLTLLRPASPASLQAAFTETLHFVTANGATGTLNLSGDGVSLSG